MYSDILYRIYNVNWENSFAMRNVCFLYSPYSNKLFLLDYKYLQTPFSVRFH